MPATRRQARRIGTARATVVTLHALLLAAVLREQVVPRDVAPIAADERLEILWLPAVTRAPPPQRLRTPGDIFQNSLLVRSVTFNCID